MSRIGKQIIEIPANVEFKLDDASRETVISVKGPLGSLSRAFSKDIAFKQDGKTLTLAPVRESLELNALWGTYAAHVQNMIEGVTKGFTKKLVVEGIGFKGEVAGQNLKLSLGFSHQVLLPIPEGLKVTSEKGVFTVTGYNKDVLGQFCANLQKLKKPEPYKGKGIRYENQVVRRKQGKKSVA